jgi:hypothetical protein
MQGVVMQKEAKWELIIFGQLLHNSPPNVKQFKLSSANGGDICHCASPLNYRAITALV